jgi:hypothetical protein
VVTQANVLHEETIYTIRDSYVTIGGYTIHFSAVGSGGLYVGVAIKRQRDGVQIYNGSLTKEHCSDLGKLFDLLSVGLKPFNKE